jgi:hypothetical protein
MVDVYRVGITLAMQGNAASALSALSHQFTGLHASAAQINSQFTRWTTLIGGMAGAFAGTKMIQGVAKIAEHGADMLHQQTLLRNLGVENLKVTEATAKAWETTRLVAGTKIAENLKAVGELVSVFGDVNEAIQAMPQFVRMAQVLGNVTGRDPDKSNVAYIAARAMELRGALIDPETHQINPALFEKQLDLMTKVVQATHGKVGPEQWLQFVQTAGPASRMLTEGGMGTAGAVIQAMGGFRAGTAMSSLFQQFFGGIMTQRTAQELQNLGIVDKEGVEVRRGGSVVLKKGAVHGLGGLETDPLSFFVDTVIPALQQHGFITQEDQLKEIYKLFGRATTQRLAAELIQNLPQIEKERAMFGRAAGIAGAGRSAAEDPTQVFREWHAALENLGTAVGAPILQAAVPHIASLANSLNSLAGFFEAQPNRGAVRRRGTRCARCRGRDRWLRGDRCGLGTALGYRRHHCRPSRGARDVDRAQYRQPQIVHELRDASVWRGGGADRASRAGRQEGRATAVL